jgi:hypothetical protein
MSAERRSRTVTAYRYAFTLSRFSSVATRIGSTIEQELLEFTN